MSNKPEEERVSDHRRLRFGSVATAITVAVVAAVVLLNVIVSVLNDRYPLSLDLTNDKMLTMSEESRAFAQSISDEVEIVVFYSEEQFSSPSTGNTEYDNMCLQFYRALQEYRSLSDGKVSYSFVDLTNDPVAAAKYSAYEVQTGNILFLSGERSSVASLDDLFTYDQMTYYYYGQLVLQTSEVEQTLALNIYKTTATDIKTVTILTGHGENSGLISVLKEALGDYGYTVTEKNITSDEEFDENSTAVIIAAPTSDYTAEELKTLRDWVENGGQRGRQVTYVPSVGASCPNLTEYFLDDFGVEITNDLVVGTTADRVWNNSQYNTFADVEDSDYTSSSDTWVRMPESLRLVCGSDAQVITSIPSPAELWDLTKWMGLTNSSTEEEINEAYQTRKADSYPIATMVLATSEGYNNSETVTAKALVCGSLGYFSYLEDTAVSNGDTFMKAFSGMVGGEETVRMPSKSLASESVDFGSSAVVNVVGLGIFTLGLPLLLLAIGLAVFLKRRRL